MIARSKQRGIFLDRAGVLIRAIVREKRPYAVSKMEEVQILDGVPEACATLSSLGYLLVLTTNQPDVARGKITRSFVDAVNIELSRRLNLDDVEVCDHDDGDHCICRKPKPGLMVRSAEKLSIDLASSIVVGDRWRDVEAGMNAGCKTVFVDYGYDEILKARPDHVAPSLYGAVDWIRSQT